jgi:HEAT repeat protein
MEAWDKQRAENRRQYQQAAAPMLWELAEAGFPVESLDIFINTAIDYRKVIPILMHWLPRIDDIGVKDSIVRSLTTKWARPQAAGLLVQEYRNTQDEYLKWVVGNALCVVADDSVFNDVVEFALDKRHGRGRNTVVEALANMKSPMAVDVLIDLLEDSSVDGNALVALRKLGKKAAKARPHIERFLNHPKAWVRKEAQRAIAKIDKVAPTR